MLLLGNFWKKLGYFLFQHLVTLERMKIYLDFFCRTHVPTCDKRDEIIWQRSSNVPRLG